MAETLEGAIVMPTWRAANKKLRVALRLLRGEKLEVLNGVVIADARPLRGRRWPELPS